MAQTLQPFEKSHAFLCTAQYWNSRTWDLKPRSGSQDDQEEGRREHDAVFEPSEDPVLAGGRGLSDTC